MTQKKVNYFKNEEKAKLLNTLEESTIITQKEQFELIQNELLKHPLLSGKSLKYDLVYSEESMISQIQLFMNM